MTQQLAVRGSRQARNTVADADDVSFDPGTCSARAARRFAARRLDAGVPRAVSAVALRLVHALVRLVEDDALVEGGRVVPGVDHAHADGDAGHSLASIPWRTRRCRNAASRRRRSRRPGPSRAAAPRTRPRPRGRPRPTCGCRLARKPPRCLNTSSPAA